MPTPNRPANIESEDQRTGRKIYEREGTDDLGYPLLEEGRIVSYEGRVWRIGLVNISRARLDPVTPAAINSPVSGKSFASYGSSISISSTTVLTDADLESLDNASINRLVRMQNEAELEQKGEGDNMATATGAAAMPVPGKTNKERVAKIAAAKTANGAANGETKVKAKAVADKECKCGCGGMTASYFVPGHDARFKGWLKKIEAGTAKKEDLMKAKVFGEYKWVKVAGGGERPTTNYKGEKVV